MEVVGYMGDRRTGLVTDEVLLHAVETARLAPSIHNTQPWRWRVGADRLELRSDQSRRLRWLDPEEHLLLISCGAAVHHTALALRAKGYLTEVELLPDPDDQQLIARISVLGSMPPDEQTLRLAEAIPVRRTDRRPVPQQRVDPSVLYRLSEISAGEGIRTCLLRHDQVYELAAAVSHAQILESLNDDQREELSAWIGGLRGSGVGVPDAVIPAEALKTTVPGREFGRPGNLDVGGGHDDVAVYTVLYGDDDERISWVRCGSALSAVWLAATVESATVVPYSAPVEVVNARQVLRWLLSDVGFPYLVLRIGKARPDSFELPRTPRLAAEALIER